MQEIVNIFKKITKIPHCSFKAEKLKEFLIKECEKYADEVREDEFGNVTAYRGSAKIALQAHYDMVCIGKAPDIEIIEKDGFLKAKESSLGADNGVGVAMALYFFKKYENIEVLFTADEEVGLIGAQNLNLPLKSENMINLDSEEEGNIFVGCAGGADIFSKKEIEFEKLDKNSSFFEIFVKDLPGGHSGVDIDKNIPNAIKELGYFLKSIKDVKIISIEGGEALNSIPKNAKALVASNHLKTGSFGNIEVRKTDKNFEKYIKNSKEIVNFICAFSNGVREWDREFDIPRTSVNFGKIYQKDSFIYLEFFPRSMTKDDLRKTKTQIECFLDSFGFDFESRHEFPPWRPDISDFSKKVLEISKKYFKEPKFKAIHAGLECGILKDKFKKIDVVSIGPNIYFPHSIKEKCEIESIFRVAKVVDEVIKETQ